MAFKESARSIESRKSRTHQNLQTAIALLNRVNELRVVFVPASTMDTLRKKLALARKEIKFRS